MVLMHLTDASGSAWVLQGSVGELLRMTAPRALLQSLLQYPFNTHATVRDNASVVHSNDYYMGPALQSHAFDNKLTASARHRGE